MAKPQMDMAGYTAWHGGECPVAHDERVNAQLRSGQFVSGFAYKYDWDHLNKKDDIVAYAVIPKREAAPIIVRRPASPYQATRDRPETLDELITDYCDFKREIFRQIRTVVKWQKAHTPTQEAMEVVECQ